ncbi:MAG TPA: PA14 domain-containing protein, partial [Cyclobacteriaceae bacterium]|nr:PA14 domain-containing protein [Cyclobacteriaceae bacterium]
SFNYTLTNPDGSGGIISGNQDLCMSTLDPAPFTSVSPANFCSGSPTYRWEVLDGSTWIPATPAGTDETYDIPAGLAPGEYSYRRVAIFGAVELASNVVQVSAYTPMGDQTSYGDNAWIGYVYDNEQDWTNDYRGKIDRPTNFDESFCAGFCEFQTDGCPVEASSFSVRFKNSVDFECGSYLITVGGDDGVRLIVDGEIVTEFDKLSPHSYETYSKVMYFDGTPDTELELLYFESGGANRVSFSAVFLGPGNAGTIGGNQYSCNTGIVPGVITNVSEATACASTPITYQWQYSLDGLGWVDIPSATGSSYTPSDPIDVTHYYRRQVTIDGYTWSSNVVTVEVDPPQGDQVTYGQNQWIGYVYEGFQDANPWDPTKYHGYMIRETNFDTPFCGPSCMQPINGCDFLTDNFSIRFLNEMTLACGYYKITIGFNGGGRLYVDENPTPVLSEYWIHDPYETLETTLYFEEGPHKFRYEYREDLHGNRVSFNIEYLGAGIPAVLDNNQVLCAPDHDPAPIIQFAPADFECSGDTSPTHQWQISSDRVNWTDIPLANGVTYDPPGGHTFTRYYRRVDTDNQGNELISDVIVIGYSDDDRPLSGSEFGTAPEWIGHVYDGINNYSDYQGSYIITMDGNGFDETFCNPDECVFEIDGCDIYTNSFTVQYRTRINLPPGSYTFTIGSDAQARLWVDGNLVVDDYTPSHTYREVSNTVPLDLTGGTYELILDYSEGFFENRVSFSYTSVPLPVTWSYFNGYYAGGQSFLEWHTASEINNEGFEVEHSADGTNFVKIGWVEGNGNTTIAHQYQFVHNDPKPGWNYYRLKQIDYDGKYEYSRLIPVFADDLPRVEIYPNPLVNERLYLSRVNTDQPVQVTLTNMLGQDPFDLVQDPMQPTCFYLPRRLAPGVYHARIRLGDVVHTRKVIVE